MLFSAVPAPAADCVPMSSPFLPIAAAFGVALLLAWATTPAVERIARAYGFMDRPNPRRETILKPRLGGVAMFLAFVAAVGITAPFVPRDAAEAVRVSGILLGALVAVAMGVLDDRLDLPALPQLAAQVAAALAAMACGVLVAYVTNPFGTDFSDSLLHFPLWLAFGFTLFWIVGAINTVNFVDGVDGLAAGVALVAAVVLGVHSVLIGQYTIAVLPAALAGCALGFLRYNFYPSRITMGTSGSAFLGFALATLSIVGGAKLATLLLVLGVPIVDTGWIILRRLAEGRSPFSGDRGHLHHRLLALGFTPRQIALIVYSACAGSGALALLLSSRLAKLFVLGGMTIVLVGILALIAQARLRPAPPAPFPEGKGE